MDWIRRTIEQAGSNPYSVSVSECPAAGTAFQAIRMDPDGDGQPDDIRVQADVGIPDGLIVGSAGNCTQADEDVTIAHNPANNTITRFDRGTDAGPIAWTDGVFTGLQFQYLRFLDDLRRRSRARCGSSASPSPAGRARHARAWTRAPPSRSSRTSG